MAVSWNQYSQPIIIPEVLKACWWVDKGIWCGQLIHPVVAYRMAYRCLNDHETTDSEIYQRKYAQKVEK